ncbi:uncharacterized protein LOC117784743 [Drosophila innubila]|uniref:uncharacterized protein LOC117784743 n=1 Tax=Drosophila innubila TaxID=198719 RepID=UPI00148DAC03|nr:uncharacterized protein LOC117784743 [Drosophila innubila]
MKNVATPLNMYSLVLWYFIRNVFGQTNECVNCTIYNGGCQMKVTGWSAFKMSSRDKSLVVKIPPINDENEDEIVFDDTLVNCTINGFTITDTLETFVCFWSPLLGCSAVTKKEVVNKHHMDYEACKICARYCNCKTPSGSWTTKDASLGRLLTLFIAIKIFY